MADKLTPQQAAAVRDRGGKLLVSAAAGSGKTKVLVDRLLGYLTDEASPADLDDFLIITYTKAAASELRGKIAEKLSQRIAQEPENVHLQKQMQRLFLTKISTVHGFCADVLKEHAYKLDIAPDFRVADENESLELRAAVLEELLDRAYSEEKEGSDFRAFIDTQGLGRDDRLVPEIIGKVYDSAMCHLNPEGWLDECLGFVNLDEIEDASETIWGKSLIRDLHDYLDRQISALEYCRAEADACAGFEKVTANIGDSVNQLKILRGASTWDEIVSHVAIDFGRLTFPKKNPEPELAEKIKAVRSACKKGVEKKLRAFSDSSEQVLADLQQSAAATRGLISLVRSFGKGYSAVKRSRRVLDFSDLEHRMLDLLLGKSRSGITSAASEIGNRYREIMVDEYQDSNGVQDAIFEALTRKRQNCFMVGDVKQSIYQFRLADPGIFLEKYQTYVPAENAEPGQGRKVLLSHNFRSGPEIIEAVNDVFSVCMRPHVGGLRYTDAEALREGIPHDSLPEPGVELYALDIQEDTYAEEASFAAEKIDEMLKQGTLIRKKDGMTPVRAEDIVILLRSPGSVGGDFKKALESRGIRCTAGGGTDLLQTEEIATLRSLLQVILNPRQDIPLVSVLISPIFGFTADELAALRGPKKKGPIYEALLLCDNPKAAVFHSVLDILRREAGIRSLSKLIEECVSLTRLDSIFAAMTDGEVRKGNIQRFLKLVSDFEAGMPRDLVQFLDHLEALDGKGIIDPSGSSGGAVTIMSIHKSKGLEFPVVFLCGLSREFNRESLRAPVMCDQKLGIGLSVVDSERRIRYPSLSKRAISVKVAAESVSEEMRVLYVALTRARDRLIMTYASGSLENDLAAIALRMDIDGGELLCTEASCPGDWVMTTAMGRSDAGALFAIGGRPSQTRVPNIPWKIRVASAPDYSGISGASEPAESKLSADDIRYLKDALSFQYGHSEATHTPSKVTATSLKGRLKDQEAAENTSQSRQGLLRRIPSFRGGDQGVVYGNIMHKVMQHLHFEQCSSREEILDQIIQIEQKGILTRDEAKKIRVDDIVRFFESEYGRMLQSGVACLREYKFSILDDGSKYGDGLEGEKVLLQGVVDCAILEDDGITVIDFKTDTVTEDTVYDRAKEYDQQVLAYSDALGRIFEKPVKSRFLYFFRIGKYVKI